ncbi:hypothetical protein CALVIDRAFT_310842 [Calocera viscosa TUFC12733]|uniref:Uncharacterized protein n=1 Tax=Calocera viscosa (strain TUFC12733) TaxID=1330018 RepID=A0A167I2T7_CALVF|nr:hypothetical protein CALVIDRAFT_310842 [Calocera viscosa TUFC12733]
MRLEFCIDPFATSVSVAIIRMVWPTMIYRLWRINTGLGHLPDARRYQVSRRYVAPWSSTASTVILCPGTTLCSWWPKRTSACMERTARKNLGEEARSPPTCPPLADLGLINAMHIFLVYIDFHLLPWHLKKTAYSMIPRITGTTPLLDWRVIVVAILHFFPSVIPKSFRIFSTVVPAFDVSTLTANGTGMGGGRGTSYIGRPP